MRIIVVGAGETGTYVAERLNGQGHEVALIEKAPERFLEQRTLERDGVVIAAKDFLAGMTDRYAISLYEELFIPRPWGRRNVDGP